MRSRGLRANTPDSILGRRDVALVGLYGVGGISAMAAVSAALRPHSTGADTVALGLATAFALVSFLIAQLIDIPLAVRWRAKPATYVVGTLLVGGGMAGVAAADDGLSSVFLAAFVLIAAYLGLVIPLRWSVPAIVAILSVSVAIHVTNPAASTLDAVALCGLTVAGYVVGAFVHRAHAFAAHVADVLDRSDSLTEVLNRRGFFEEFEWELRAAESGQRPLSLLVMDLDSFKTINHDGGFAAGDQLLHWVGQTLAQVLPPGAGAGRLGADEFAIVLPDTDQVAADAVALRIGSGLANRIGASIGAATYVPGKSAADVDTLVRVADAELYAVKRQLDFQLPPTATSPGPAQASRSTDPRGENLATPLVTYGRLRAAGGPPKEPASGIQFSWLMRLGWWLIGGAGIVVAGVQLWAGGDTTWDLLLKLFVVPWVALCGVMGLLSDYRGRPSPRMPRLNFWLSTIVLAVGVGCVLLANNGIAGPLVAALYLKVVADGFVLPARDTRGTLYLILAFWLLVVILGPADALWAVPFELAMFIVSCAVGLVAHRAFVDATGRSQSAAQTDPLTGLRNRAGFQLDVAAALARPPRLTGPPLQLALLRLDLNDFKTTNDRIGHLAGDALLMRVAEHTRHQLQGAFAIGRISGDDFVAAVPVVDAAEAKRLAAQLGAVLAELADVSVGYAVHPADGQVVAELLAVADYRLKRATRAAPVAASVPVPADPSFGVVGPDPEPGIAAA